MEDTVKNGNGENQPSQHTRNLVLVIGTIRLAVFTSAVFTGIFFRIFMLR